MANVTLSGVYKAFGEAVISRDINLEIDDGEFVVFVGPSGCGKSTLLRMIAGLEDITSGELLIGGKRMNEVPPSERGIGMVFQSYALYPHLSVAENMSFGLKLAGAKKAEINQRVNQVAEVLQLAHLLDRRPKALSGGQRQRVAIARAIVNEPKVLLLDEPLSALDLKLRTDMQYELRELQQRLGITFIFVTHDQEEALAMSDEIFVINQGEIVQSGTPVDIYDEPINNFVADFIGESNIIKATMIDDYLIEIVGKQFECVDGGMRKNEPVEIVIRPEDLSLTTVEQGKLVARVDTQLFRGVHYEIICYDAEGNEWMVHSTRKAQEGSEVGLFFEPEDIHVMRFNESEEDFDARLESYEE